ncbi:hypothetical protein AVEN_240077-1 [Araneus ventricosus]|uniref:Uncharacterized protein n=1 Tax=Araneus ventricosus TaxID=182803 RepID=A0A4Y2KS15_ARAVE|nr:hypothetical protein AVEN_240077-1 [Araneus ventricosus]
MKKNSTVKLRVNAIPAFPEDKKEDFISSIFRCMSDPLQYTSLWSCESNVNHPRLTNGTGLVPFLTGTQPTVPNSSPTELLTCGPTSSLNAGSQPTLPNIVN